MEFDNKIKKLKWNNILRCAIIGFFTASAIFSFFIIQNKGVLTICDDFDVQQLTFPQAIWNYFHAGGKIEGWCWNLDLGSSLLNGFSFYNLGSPFFWIFLAFPKGSFPYLVGPLYVLKYTVACITSYVYLSLFCDKDNNRKLDYALIGALLYAFSGFQTVNLEFFHFHDVVAFFPLLLWGIEVIEDKKKRPLFIFFIFLNCFTNYFFFTQEVVFMGIYFIARFWGISLKDTFRKLIACLFCGIFGVGMASLLFVPNILYIMGNSRSEIALYLENFVFDSKNLLYILKGILLPGDAMRGNSAVMVGKWSSTSCYLPLFGMSCVFSFIKKDKGWIKRLLFILLIISFFPFMQSGFLLFTAIYQRWWYMMVLIMVLATVKVLENPDKYNLSWGIGLYIIILSLFYLSIVFISWNVNKDRMIFFKDRFAYYYVLAVSGPIIIDILLRIKKYKFTVILVLTIVCSILTTGITLKYYRYDSDTNKYMDLYETALKLENINDQYRYNSIDNVYTLTSSAAGIGVFSSTIENSSHDFNRLFDVDSENNSQARAGVPGLAELLGGKYGITYDENANNIIQRVSNGNISLYVTEAEACPIGFAVDGYLFYNELIKLPQEMRAKTLMNAAVIFPKDEKRVCSSLKHVDANTIEQEESTEKKIENAQRNAVSNFIRDSYGFRCETNYESDRFVYFTVPYDSGWQITIDGKKTDFIDSGGMILISVPKGPHKINALYRTPGLRFGLYLTVIFWIGFMFYGVFSFFSVKLRKN